MRNFILILTVSAGAVVALLSVAAFVAGIVRMIDGKHSHGASIVALAVIACVILVSVALARWGLRRLRHAERSAA